MKNTKYFDSVQDVNNYYPDGVPSNVIAIVGDGSNVFISSDNAGSGNQQYYSADMTNDEIVAEQVEAAEQQGYDAGYAAGEAAGGEWEPIGDAIVDMPHLPDIINGTVDSIDLYWGDIYDNLSIEEITDQESGDVVGYRFEWDENSVDVDTGETDPETGDTIYDTYTIHVIHEEYPDPETGEYVQADGISANQWFDFMFDNDGVITDLYQFVYPVMRNVTLEAATQGADYDYILRFETLASTNDHSTICDPVEEITQNGFYPANNFCAFNVNVEGQTLSLADLTILERGKFMTELGQTSAHPGYSWEFYKDVDTRWFENIFDQNADYLYSAFKTHSTNSAQIVCYKINNSNEVNQVQLNLQAYNLDPTYDSEGTPQYTVGGYGYFTLNLNAGEKVGFYVIFNQYEAHCLLTKDAYTDSTTQMTDHWFTANETGTYMMKYEITDHVEDPETGDNYYVITGSFTKVTA